MRPIRLRMSAFGPFVGIENIDFTELGDNPLFLINGPTGSGKSTILDAICFALYGETTGNEREAKQMRCDQADASIMTEVTLEFQLASGVYSITRIPDQERPKARGEGVTEQKARAELYKLEGDKTSLICAPKITEVTNDVVNLTGLSADQFRQVMVLPQGKFRELLLAKSEERETIFQQLFQTHVYSTLQARLRDQANALTAQLKDIQLQQKALLETLELESSEQLQTELESVSKNIKELEQQKQLADEKLKQAQADLNQAKILEEAFLEHARLQGTVLELQARQADIEKQKTILEQAGQAREIEPLFQDLEKQKIELVKVQQQLRDSEQNLIAAEKALQALDLERQQLPENRNTLEALNANILELESYRQRSMQLRAAQQTLVDADKALAISEKLVDEQKTGLTDSKQSLETLEADLQKQSSAVAGLAVKKNNLEKLEAQGKSIRRISDLQTEADKLDGLIVGLKQDEDKAGLDYQQKSRDKDIYEQAWQKGQAAILAMSLQDSEACPVCGSTDHPAIASGDEKLPTEQELKRKQTEAEQVRTGLETLTRERLLKEEEYKNLLMALNEEKSRNTDKPALSLDEIRLTYQKAQDEIKALQNISDSLSALQQKIADTKDDIKNKDQILVEAQSLALEQSNASASARTDVINKQAELPELYRQADALEEALGKSLTERDQLKQHIEKLEKAYQQARESTVAAKATIDSVRRNEQSIEAQLGESLNVWQQGLQKSVFKDEQGFINARMEKATEQQLTATIRQYEDEKLLAQKRLEEKAVAIVDKVRPDMSALIEKEKFAVCEKNTVDTQYHKAAQRQIVLDATKYKLKKSLQQQDKLEAEYGVIGKLSDISNGKNPHNLSLQRFVLSVLLDDVLTEASFRLNKMSKGRYQLYRKESVGDKRSKSGLELEVEDAYTGKQRPAATLSGGESFMAALALALGLSDVVQAYAGGIRLDALFIDEGFGSLDPESLDLAINTLLELRDSGRMVGVISHVEEMKRIINLRLDVIADRGVSHIRLIGA